jgi:hypothetical protein
MPQTWQTHWPDGIVDDPEASARRDFLIDTIGNLTLVTKSLNGTLSHRPWTDANAAKLPGTEDDKGLGKRSLLNKYSVLLLTRPIVDNHPHSWTDDDIVARSEELAKHIAKTWPIN